MKFGAEVLVTFLASSAFAEAREACQSLLTRLALCGLAASLVLLAFRSRMVRDAFARIRSVWRSLTLTAMPLPQGLTTEFPCGTSDFSVRVDPRGLATTMRDGVNFDVTRWSYDAVTGLCTNKVYADGSAETYTYTADALPLRTVRPDGSWTENVYDANRRKIGVVSSDGALDIAMTRDVFGNVTSESNAVSFAAYSLDNRGNVTGEVQTVEGVSASLVRDFDAYGRLVRIARVGGERMDCAYASDGRLCAVSNASANAAYSFTTDRLDAGCSLELADGSSFSRVLRRHGYQRNCIVSVTNAVGNVAEGLSYAYDALSRPISRNDDSFGYNERGEVVFSRRGAENVEDSYTYDDIGNLLCSAVNFATNAYVSNSRNQYASIQCASEPPRETSYDLNGNMTRHGDWTYSYDSGNRLVSVSSNNALIATFAYDAQGRRVKKVAAEGTHRYFYDGWLLVYEHVTRPDSTISEIEYVWGKDVSGTRSGAAGIGGLLYLKRDGAIYVPFYDAYGNILGYRDAQGNVVASYTYDAFGNTVLQSGSLADTFSLRFSTKYFDSETGLYYYGYRYYKPLIMRWLTEDPIGEAGGRNLYAVCCNNVLAQCDSLGLFAIYVHEEGAVGHVGLRLANGTAYDYGRYRGTYSGLGLAFSGPNVLMTNQWNDVSLSHEYTVFDFNVCKVIEDGVSKAANSRFNKGHSQWPDDVRFAKFKKLRANERYMGTDWNWNDDNCMTFTFRTIVAGVKEARRSGELPRKATRQAQTLLWLSFDACFQPRPKEVKSLLERYVQSSDWMSKSR